MLPDGSSVLLSFIPIGASVSHEPNPPPTLFNSPPKQLSLQLQLWCLGEKRKDDTLLCLALHVQRQSFSLLEGGWMKKEKIEVSAMKC